MIVLIILFYVLLIVSVASIIVACKKTDLDFITNDFYIGILVVLCLFILFGCIGHIWISADVKVDRQKNKELSVNAEAKLKNAKEKTMNFSFVQIVLLLKQLKI